MFMVQENEAQKERLEKLYKKIEVVYGQIPPQMRFLGNIEADYVEEFLVSMLSVLKHPHINVHLFGFLRLHVAYKEDYAYCKMFNTKLLLSYGYGQDELDKVIKDIGAVPFDEKHKNLAKKAIEAIYDGDTFTQDGLDALYAQGWTQKDVFDAIDHTGTILKNGRILKAYSS